MFSLFIYLVFDFFFHFQKKYKPTPDRAYIPMNIYIGFTLSPKRYAMRRLRAVLNYFSSFTNDDLITFLPSSNMMVRLALFSLAISVIGPSPKTLCLTLSPMSKSAMMINYLEKEVVFPFHPLPLHQLLSLGCVHSMPIQYQQ